VSERPGARKRRLRLDRRRASTSKTKEIFSRARDVAFDASPRAAAATAKPTRLLQQYPIILPKYYN
jgi:hypothetical protein